VAQRLAAGKLWNSGQTCVAPDYMFLPKGKTAEFIEHYSACVAEMYPNIEYNQDYTSIINDKQYNRLQGYLEDARNQGAKIIEINPAHENLSLVRIDDVIEFINSRPRPLALYYFDFDQARADYVAQRTHSGHFGQNTVLTHVAQDDLPFGGVGASGMGKYHGPEGFFSLSHERSVMSNPKLYSLKFILPPFNKPIHRLISKTLLR